jgi:hypothetical protein
MPKIARIAVGEQKNRVKRFLIEFNNLRDPGKRTV